jgi:hypothetical protein
LIVALRRSDRTKGGQPPFDPVMMCKILALHALYSLSDEGTEFQIKDRLSFQRFLGIGPQGKVPSATTGGRSGRGWRRPRRSTSFRRRQTQNSRFFEVSIWHFHPALSAFAVSSALGVLALRNIRPDHLYRVGVSLKNGAVAGRGRPKTGLPGRSITSRWFRGSEAFLHIHLALAG